MKMPYTGAINKRGELEVPEREPSIFVNILSSMHILFIPFIPFIPKKNGQGSCL